MSVFLPATGVDYCGVSSSFVVAAVRASSLLQRRAFACVVVAAAAVDVAIPDFRSETGRAASGEQPLADVVRTFH